MRTSISKSGCDWVFCEIEKDNLKNKSIWNKFGFLKIPVDYSQFSLGQGRSQVDNLLFCVKPVKSQIYEIDSSLVRNAIWMYYRYAQIFSDPTNTEPYKRVLNSTSSREKLKLGKLV